MRMRWIAKPGRHWPGFFVGACLALAAGAQAQVRGSGDYLARMDRDGDGRVSLAEYQDWLSYAFDAMDRDHDGVLATAELPGGRGAAITRAQHRARLAAAFARQDRNHDGFLDARELAAPPR
jgi:Ca2+-binding EF-hand superfamily protein